MTKSKYAQLGVDAGKGSVRQAFKDVVKNDFPGAFVNIARDPDIPGLVHTMHPDGDGSKMVQRITHFLETGDAEIFQGAVDDAFTMNAGDVAASGFVFGKWFLTDIININALTLPKKLILGQLAQRFKSLLDLYQTEGFGIVYFMGGETADLPNQVCSATFDMDIKAEAWESDLILGNTQPGDCIFGFASDGQAVWEDRFNFGLMANGLTSGRIHLMSKAYNKKYPFLVGFGKKFMGRFEVNDQPDILNGATISQALLSPTRQWAILIRLLLEELKKRGISSMLHGISMNTGGGATKITHVGRGGIVYEKNMPMPPSIFQLIKQESGEVWRNMYQSFNCGVGLDIVGEDCVGFLGALASVSRRTGVTLYDLGKCYKGVSGRNIVRLKTPFGTFDDYHKD